MPNTILVCGSLAFDTIAVFDGHFKDHLLADNIQSLSVSFFVPSMRKEYGGCAGNIAYNLRQLGANPIPVGTVGGDAADYLEYMKKQGIDTRLVRVLPDMFTPQCFITTDLDNNQIASFHPGAMQHSADNDLSGTPAAWGIVAPDAKEGMFAHAERLREENIPFVFDLGQAMPLFDKDDLERMFELTQILSANDYEATVIEQRTGRKIADIARSLQAAVITRGAEGATLYENGTETSIEGIPVDKVVDPTGCGDAHRAGLLYGLQAGWSLIDACRLANVLGAIKIGSRGPQNHALDQATIRQLMQKHYQVDVAL
ncbi:MAG TPA: carbohydrate kinase family protein [Burkholderiaceae bacterium]|nr:carbohydrate kinase family protein [Burkholderiaceae bacterium]